MLVVTEKLKLSVPFWSKVSVRHERDYHLKPNNLYHFFHFFITDASPNAESECGSTALIQACHFGKLEVAKELIKNGAAIEQANHNNTTALMRASQEGHEEVVKLLLKHNCHVNRKNDEQRMSALMLCSQRGHAGVAKLLIKAGADINAVTNQNSTPLMLAIKRKNLEVSKILVASGAELNLKDNKDRTALDTARRRELAEFPDILTSEGQIRLMQEHSRKVRNFMMVRMWNLLQSERASIKILHTKTTVHKISNNLDDPTLQQLCPSKRTLVRAMTMPAPVMELITSFIPLPLLYETRLQLLASRSQVDPDSAVYETMDLIDEVLEEGGVLQAFDEAKVPPPTSFTSWVSHFIYWFEQLAVGLQCEKISLPSFPSYHFSACSKSGEDTATLF